MSQDVELISAPDFLCLHSHSTSYMLVFSSPTSKGKSVFLLDTNAVRLNNSMLGKYFEILGRIAEKQSVVESPGTIRKIKKPLSIS